MRGYSYQKLGSWGSIRTVFASPDFGPDYPQSGLNLTVIPAGRQLD
jgi:hypothetical protein